MERVRKIPTSASVHEFPILQDGTVSRMVRIEVENKTGDVRVTTTGNVTIIRPFTIAGLYLRDPQLQGCLGRPDIVAEPDGGFVIDFRGPLQDVTMHIGQQVWPVRPAIRDENFVLRLSQRVDPPRFDFSAGYRQSGIRLIASQLLLHVTPLEDR